MVPTFPLLMSFNTRSSLKAGAQGNDPLVNRGVLQRLFVQRRGDVLRNRVFKYLGDTAIDPGDLSVNIHHCLLDPFPFLEGQSLFCRRIVIGVKTLSSVTRTKSVLKSNGNRL